jgi:DivIVA domain-containing protein
VTWVFIGLVVLVVAAVAVVAVGHGAGLAVAQPDRPEVAFPADRMLTGADLDSLGLTVGLRGYRMDEVDDLLTRLATEIDERDRRLAELAPPAAGPVAAEPAGPVAAEPAGSEPQPSERR